jgi:hypothetical protein
MDFAALTKAMIPAGAALLVAHFAKNAAVKAAALGVAGVVIARQLPILKEGLA